MRFADRTDAEISRLVSAASGSEGFQAQATVSSFDESFDPDPCPTIAISGDRVTITGGCTTRDGVMIEGSAAITNPFFWGDDDQIEYDFNDDTVFEMTGLALVQTNFTRSFDGTFIVSASFTEQKMDVTTELLGVAVRSDIDLDCGRTSCSVSGGVELVGAGGAHVSGKITVAGNVATASYTLKAADTVKVTMENNCVSWQLEGTDRGFDPCNR